MCHVSHVTCHVYFFFDIVVQLMSEVSVIKVAYPVYFFCKMTVVKLASKDPPPAKLDIF